MANFLRGEPQVANESDIKGCWMGGKNGEHFRCNLCGYKFVLGDYWRCVYTNDQKDGTVGGNPIVCKTCDSGNDGVRKAWTNLYRDFMSERFWVFRVGSIYE